MLPLFLIQYLCNISFFFFFYKKSVQNMWRCRLKNEQIWLSSVLQIHLSPWQHQMLLTCCTFTPKLYAADAKWQPLRRNDYETIIIWKSPRVSTPPLHLKCSQHTADERHATAGALISKRNFSSPLISIVSPSQRRERTRRRRESAIACEI